jgi:hypothetical protein
VPSVIVPGPGETTTWFVVPVRVVADGGEPVDPIKSCPFVKAVDVTIVPVGSVYKIALLPRDVEFVPPLGIVNGYPVSEFIFMAVDVDCHVAVVADVAARTYPVDGGGPADRTTSAPVVASCVALTTFVVSIIVLLVRLSLVVLATSVSVILGNVRTIFDVCVDLRVVVFRTFATVEISSTIVDV